MTFASVVNHDVPTDPVALKAKRREQKQAALASAEASLAKAKLHLKAAEQTVADAKADLKGTD